MARTYKENGGWRTDGNGISVWAATFGKCIELFLTLIGFGKK